MRERSSELKACPFCGGPATVCRVECHPTAHRAECTDTDCAVHPSVRSDGGRGAAIERWNTRTLDAAPVASGPTHDRQGIVAQLLDSASIRELPNWVRVLMQRAADAIDAAPADPVVGVGRSPQSIMMSAHALCPSEITAHTARMRWMADYFMRELAREGR